ncbi:MAG TPA: AI-2E family transporter, partial [Salinarimonas sp.]|nr:AI-2E family transporter [Salinarimonas sp.]
MAEPATPPPLQPAGTPPPTPLLSTASGIVLVIGALYFGQDIFIPFALATLLAFALTPLVDWFRRIRFPRIAAVITAVALAFVLIAGIAYVVGTQLVQLANNLPAYQTTIQQKIRSLQSSAPGGGVVDRVTTTIQDLSKELSSSTSQETSAAPGPDARGRQAEREPIPVRIEQGQAQPLQVIRTIVGPLLAPLATAGIVVVFVIFVLLEREDLRDRFIKLVGAGDLQKSTHALNDAAARVSRYLLMQLVVNLTYGVPIGVALYFIGVPNAVLWGLLAAVLRFVPYLGPFLAALFPLALAFAVDPGWTMLLWVAALFLGAELISNNVVEPWLYGSSTGLSSLAIITAAIFWTTLWGPVGLFLATPLTVCVVVIGRYVPHLEFLGVLLGNDPVLAPEERFYQRLLAGNLEEAVDLAETYVDEHSSGEFYERIGLPALRLAENDRQRSVSDMTYRRQVAETATCVVREIEDHVREGGRSEEASEAVSRQFVSPVRVLCVAGRTELDRAASEMVAGVLGER